MVLATVAWVADKGEVLKGLNAKQGTLSGTAGELVGFSAPFEPPLVLFAIATVIARASIRSMNTTPEAHRIARRVYLYSDGAHGLLAQTLLSAAVALPGLGLICLSRYPEAGLLILGSAPVILMVAAVWQTVVTYSRVKGDLFAFDDSLAQSELFRSGEGQPLVRFLFALSFSVPLAVFVVNLVFVLGCVLAGSIIDSLRAA